MLSSNAGLLSFHVAALVLLEIASCGLHYASAAATTDNVVTSGVWLNVTAAPDVNEAVTRVRDKPAAVTDRPDAYHVTGSAEGHDVAILVVEGDSVTIRCPSVGPTAIRWDFKRVDWTVYATVVSGGNVRNQFANRSDVTHRAAENASYFTVTGIRGLDAGSYKCMNSSNGKAIGNFSLTVLASAPTCDVNATSAQSAISAAAVDADLLVVAEYDRVTVGCALCFTGGATVNMSCVDNGSVLGGGGNDGGGTTPHVVDSSSPMQMCREHRQTFVSTRRVQSVRFMCRVNVSFEGVVLRTDNWRSKLVRTRYDPSSAKIEYIANNTDDDTNNDNSSSGGVRHGDRLRCSADGYPPPKYKWTVGNFVHNDAEYVVDICRLFSNSVKGTTRSVKFDCFAVSGTISATQSVDMDVSVVDYWDRCVADVGGGEGGGGQYDSAKSRESDSATSASPSTTQYLVIGGAIGSVLLVIVVVVTVVVRCRKSHVHESLDQLTKKKPDVNVFYNDACGTRSGPYEELPDYKSGKTGRPSVYNVYDEPVETFDEIVETESNVVNSDNQPSTKPYEGLEARSREPTPPPYIKLDTTTAAEPAATEDQPGAKPYEKLEAQSPGPTPTPYNKLNTTTAADPASTEVESTTKPYEGLEKASLEPPPLTAAYNKLHTDVKFGTKPYDDLEKALREPPHPPAVYNKLNQALPDREKPTKPTPKPKTYERLPAGTHDPPPSTEIYSVSKQPAGTASTAELDKDKSTKPKPKPKPYERLQVDKVPSSTQIYNVIDKKPTAASSSPGSRATVHSYLEVMDDFSVK